MMWSSLVTLTREGRPFLDQPYKSSKDQNVWGPEADDYG